MAEILDSNIFFLNSLFTDQVYSIGPKKNYGSKIFSDKVATIKEDAVAYNTLNLQFSNITSKTLLLFNYPNETDIPLEDKLFLDQVLKAAGLFFEKLSRLYLGGHNENVTWEAIAAQSTSDFVIAFGVANKFMPDGITEGQAYNINGKRVICSASLPELSINGAKKKQLWQGLKEIYGL